MTDLRSRLEATFGARYAASVARDQVIPELDGLTIDQALSAGFDAQAVWRAVVAAYPDRVPVTLR